MSISFFSPSSANYLFMSQRATAANAASLRRKTARRRSAQNTLVQAILTTIVANNESVSNAAPTTSTTISDLSVPMPLEFVKQSAGIPVPVKRRRQKEIDQLDEPLQTKNVSLGRAMMKRDRLLQQIWKKTKTTDAKNENIAIRLQEVNKAIEALEKKDTPKPTPDQVKH